MELRQEFWYGTEALWTFLPISGSWKGLPRYNSDTEGYRQKVFWWREDYDSQAEPKPKLVVTGRRLDGDGSFAVSNATNASTPNMGSTMLVGIDIPTHGCWEITGHYDGQTLSFVVSVDP